MHPQSGNYQADSVRGPAGGKAHTARREDESNRSPTNVAARLIRIQASWRVSKNNDTGMGQGAQAGVVVCGGYAATKRTMQRAFEARASLGIAYGQVQDLALCCFPLDP